MLQIPPSPVPCISISPAPHELPPMEPKSPFNFGLSEEPLSPKPVHLLPPPTLTPQQMVRIERHGRLSPLSTNGNGKGLDKDKFEALLKASRERSAIVGAKKPVGLRKEIALKAQMAKQLERRVKFLNKLAQPPSPSAADMPVTPPESPAIFHFSLPSPGLESPIEVFENLNNDPSRRGATPRIEQVDFRLPGQKMAAEAKHARHENLRGSPMLPLPSLEQISQRLAQNDCPIKIIRTPSPDEHAVKANRLPSFLRSRSPSPSPEMKEKEKKSRLPLPVFGGSGFTGAKEPSLAAPQARPFPPSPRSPQLPKLQVTTTICPPTKSNSSPTKLTEANVSQFASASTQSGSFMASRIVVNKPAPALNVSCAAPARRAELTRDMFNKLSRRTPCLAGAATCGIVAKDDIVLASPTEDKLKRRTSAPAELPASQRKPRHPVLDKPGGF